MPGSRGCACAYSKPWSQCLFNLDHATLEDDPDFKIENHVKFHQSPEDASEAQLMETALAIFRKPLDRKRPLWEVHLFSGELLISPGINNSPHTDID